jgi:hypothetical protein
MNKNEIKKWLSEKDKKFERILREDKLAKKNKTLVGRFLQEHIADGYAYYLIVADNGKRCKVQQITGLWDDWQIRRFELNPWVSRREVVDNVERRDALNALFGR